MKTLFALAILFMLFSSCSLGVYSHYPKAKRVRSKRVVHQPKTFFKKEHYALSSLSLKSSTIVTDFSNLSMVELKSVAKPSMLFLQQNITTIPPGDGKPRDATQTNKKAKRAFTSSLIAIGGLVFGITLTPIFLIVMVLFAIIAFVYSIKALKEIRRTGEHGKARAEFALYSSIPILVLSIVGLLAYLMSNGAGIQIGNFVLR